MASTTKEKKTARTYYKKHKKYREEKIAQVKANQRANREEYNASKREYYASNEKYREYKKKYAAKYRREEPIKSRARKYRGRVR